MHRRIAALVSWLALPVYFWQGLKLRRSVPRLEPPRDPIIAPVEGEGEPIRILLIGDSSAAGVGVDDIHDSLGGQVVAHLKTQTNRPIFMRVAGCNSATAGQLRDFVVPNIEHQAFTHVLLNVGTNDAKNFHTGKRFCKEFGTLLYALNTRFPGAVVIWSSILDLSTISTMPTPLNHILGIRSRELASRGAILCAERLAQIADGDWDPSPENFARDGFHASKKGYGIWAGILAKDILNSCR